MSVAEKYLLDAWRRELEAGDGRVLLDIVVLVALGEISMPQWAAQAFSAILARAHNGEIESWDEVFGKPGVGGKHKQIEKRQFKVWNRVRELRARGESVTNDLFDRVGEKMGMSRAAVSRCYYKQEKVWKLLRDRASAHFSEKL